MGLEMTTIRLVLEVITYSLTLWLGLYLIARNVKKTRLRYAGLGAVAYALGLALDLLVAVAGEQAEGYALQNGVAFMQLLLSLPALFWIRTIIELLPQTHPQQERLRYLWRNGLLPGIIGLHLLGWLGYLMGFAIMGAIYSLLSLLLLLSLLGALLLVAQVYRALPVDEKATQKPVGLLLVASLFFALSIGLLLFPLEWLSRSLVLLAIGGDIIGLGLAIALLDAFEEGETLRPDFFRAFDASLLSVLLFGGLVAQTMVLGTGVTFPMIVLLLAMITAAIGTQVFADQIQTLLDRLTFGSAPQLQEARAELRTEASILPRIDDALDLDSLEQDEWRRLTRRALSNMGNLPRLATSPLARLPLVYVRLSKNGGQHDTLERAAELKRLLTESIMRLKPPDKGDFGSSKEWRHYNSLYFPYVVGLKPYSRRTIHHGLDSTAQDALEWFRRDVPNRTLYNWQNAAAKLVAQDLRERHAGMEGAEQGLREIKDKGWHNGVSG